MGSRGKSSDIVAVDLFCGVGGLTYGLQAAGVQVSAGIDSDASCSYAFEKNNNSTFIKADVKDVSRTQLIELFHGAKIKVLAGCAPCQTFSKHALKQKRKRSDERWTLLYAFQDLINCSNPDIVTMENVPQLRNYKVFRDFVKGLKAKKYNVSYQVVQCPKYGIPQNRSRLVLLASKLGEIKLIAPSHSPDRYVTVEETIGQLSPISDGEVDRTDSLHRSWGLSPINKKRIKQSKEGGTWQDWDEDLLLPCHKKKSGSSYKAVYGRMSWKKTAPTITTQFYSYGTGRFGHPNQDRAISLREGALIQTFPKNYSFFKDGDEVSFNTVGRHIGNAVPVKLGEVIGKSIVAHVESFRGK